MGSRDETVSLGAPRGRGPLCVIVTGPSGSSTHALPKHGTVRVGRSPECEIVIDHHSVSRVHAVVHLQPALTIEDLGSRNGTLVLGRRLVKGERSPIPTGAAVEIGAAVLVLSRTPFEAAPPPPSELVIASESMRRIYDSIPAMAASPLSILVLGETGVGKDALARAIHERSPRAAGPFVALNCAALPETIVESELFGYVKGAFTGAVHAKMGLFEAAHQGTLFLDEAADLSLVTQAKLLRVLETGEVTPLGAVRPKRIDVRVIAATNRDPTERVRTGAMRNDLYFRLDGMTVSIPPLRERKEDLRALVELFTRQAAARHGRRPPAFDEEATRALEEYPWPGNIRELRSVVERAVALSSGTPRLGLAQLQLRFSGAAAAPAAPTSEREQIVQALARTSGNQTAAAQLLGVSRRTLIRRIAEHAIGRPRKDAPR